MIFPLKRLFIADFPWLFWITRWVLYIMGIPTNQARSVFGRCANGITIKNICLWPAWAWIRLQLGPPVSNEATKTVDIHQQTSGFIPRALHYFTMSMSCYWIWLKHKRGTIIKNLEWCVSCDFQDLMSHLQICVSWDEWSTSDSFQFGPFSW